MYTDTIPWEQIDWRLSWSDESSVADCTSEGVIYRRARPLGKDKQKEEDWYLHRKKAPRLFDLLTAHQVSPAECFNNLIAIMMVDIAGLPPLSTSGDEFFQEKLKEKRILRDELKPLTDRKAVIASLRYWIDAIYSNRAFCASDSLSNNLLDKMVGTMREIIQQYFDDGGSGALKRSSLAEIYYDLQYYIAGEGRGDIVSCRSMQTYLSTTLHLFLVTADALKTLSKNETTPGYAITKKFVSILLRNYVAMVLAVEHRNMTTESSI